MFILTYFIKLYFTLFPLYQIMKSVVDLSQTPSDYFSLIERVGSQGKYQKIVFLIMSINWFVAALLLMGTSFLYLSPDLQCEDKKLSSEQCEKYVCSLPRQQWEKHLQPKLVQSLSTQFGPYLCSDTQNLNFLRSTLYVGVFFGYMVFLSFADNHGRKVSLIAAWALTTIGLALLSISWSMIAATVGLFLTGAGCESSIRIGIAYINQTIDPYVRQKYSIAMQSSFGITGILIGILFYVIKHWRVIIIFFSFIPSLLVLVFMCTYFEETPKFLLRKGGYETLRALNRIAQINGKETDDYLKYQDLLSYLQKAQMPKSKQTVTPLSLFTYQSLRTKTICTSLLFFFLNYIYLGPIVIVDKLGINPFLSQVIVSSSEIIAYPIVYIIIDRTPRKDSGSFLFTLSAIFTGILILLHKPENCHSCFLGIVQIVLIFCSRFCISVYFAIFFVYVPELFPLSVRALGFGVGSSVGSISSASSQVVLPYFQQRGYNPMILFTGMALCSLLALHYLPQTKDKEQQQQIEQIQQQVEWSLGGSLKTETNIMYKTAKSHYYDFLKCLFPRLSGFNRVQEIEEG